MMSVMAGHDESDSNSSDRPVPNYVESIGLDVKGVKIGVPRNYFFERCEVEVRGTVERAIDLLQQLGCKIVEFEFPHIQEIIAATTAIDNCESSAYHAKMLTERPTEYNPDVRLLLEQGMFVPATYYIKALRYRSFILPKVLQLFKRFDVVMTPSVPVLAPRVGESSVRIDGYEEGLDSALSRYVAPFNLIGLLALSIPCGFSSSRLPIGMQIAGYPFDEATVLRVGGAYERATNWYLNFPQIE
jgi:aspartyl-tRNA(Asn)/glutamyl-tRNA(Gln) amidotransferase subunit A